MLIKEKVEQAIEILKEYDIDCWITFVRESGMMRDPMMDFLCAADMTWHSAFIVTEVRRDLAIVGQMEKQTIEDMGVYENVIGYVEGIKERSPGHPESNRSVQHRRQLLRNQRGLRRSDPRDVPDAAEDAGGDRIRGPAGLGGEDHLEPEGPEDRHRSRADEEGHRHHPGDLRPW